MVTLSRDAMNSYHLNLAVALAVEPGSLRRDQRLSATLWDWWWHWRVLQFAPAAYCRP
jgi:hypothetical protein